MSTPIPASAGAVSISAVGSPGAGSPGVPTGTSSGAGAAPVLIGEPSADTIAATVSGLPAVARLSGGTVGEVATYLPGRRVTGIRVQDDAVTVHLVARYGTPLPEVADAVRSAIAGLVGGRRVDVGVDDVEVTEADLHRSILLPAGPGVERLL